MVYCTSTTSTFVYRCCTDYACQVSFSHQPRCVLTCIYNGSLPILVFILGYKHLTFLQKILQGGTLSDRLSALTLLVQSSPLHNVRALESLKNMAERGKGKGGREESLKALRCIVDWWVGGGVPNRKLKYVCALPLCSNILIDLDRYFRDQPLTNPGVTDQHLLLWYFEDWLKKYFFSILQVLEVCQTIYPALESGLPELPSIDTVPLL